MHSLTALHNNLQRLTKQLEMTPDDHRVCIQRGMVSFQLGDIAAAIEDFDRAERLYPAVTPYLWQRGLAYYYAGRFADGVRQFEVDLTVNSHDVEETVWRYLCQAQLLGAAAARANLYPVKQDTRPVMGWIYQLFAGTCDADDVLAQYRQASRHNSFYSHLYVGLYFEAAGNSERACHHIGTAAALHVVEDYMGWVAMVHQHLRGWDTP